ncbi:MAG: ABC transporter substrate-binding protein [Phycisphaerales bacterium]
MRRAKFLLMAYLIAIGCIIFATIISLALSPPVARDTKTFYEAYWNTVNTFDPVKAYDTVSNLMVDQSLEGLFEYDGDKWNFDIIPCLASELPEISNDGTVYIIRIRPNVRYSTTWWDDASDEWKPVEPWGDTPRHVTAHDFVFSMKRLCDFHNSSPHYAGTAQDRLVGATEFFNATEQRDETTWYYDDIELAGARALDDYTLRLELKQPYPQLIYKLMGNAVSPMPQEYYEFYARNPANNEHDRDRMKYRMLGTGPYLLAGYERERHVRFVKNEHYRGRPDVDGHPSGQGGTNPLLAPERVLPYSVEQQEYIFSKNDLARWFNFKLGAFDKIQQIPKDKFGAAMEGGEISPDLAAIGMRQSQVPWPSIEYIAFHVRDHPVLRNKPLRQAMSLAIDRVQYNRQFRNNEEIVPNGLVPPGSFTYDENHQATWYRYDPEEARKLADEAKRLHRERHGEALPKLTLSFRATSSATRQAAEFLKLSWAQIGIEVEMEFYDFGKWLDNLRNRNYQINSAGWVGDYPDEETFLQLFYSPNYAGGGSNSTGFSSREFDALYEQAKVMMDSPERRDLYLKMAAIVEEELPVIMLYYRTRREFFFDWIGEDFKPHVYLRAQPAYFHFDGELRARRLSEMRSKSSDSGETAVE